MNIVIIGCTESTRRFINEIIRHKEFKISAIFTLNDMLAQKKSRFTILDDIASDNKIKLFKLSKINDVENVNLIKSLKPDIILESGWSQLIPKEILEIPPKGCIGMHYSMLPKNQGAASLNWALINDEKKWGVTLFYLVEKIDDGDIIDQREFYIEDRDNIRTLFDKADLLAVEMLAKNLFLIKNSQAPRIKQDKTKVTYLSKRRPEDGKIDWKNPTRDIFNIIRAITKPYPGAFTFYDGKKIVIWEAEPFHEKIVRPGKIEDILENKGIVVGTSDGAVLVKYVQFGGIDMWADDLAEKIGMKKSDFFE